MTTVQELPTAETFRSDLADRAYHSALSQCEELCQALGGIRDGQIDAILGELSDLNQRTRSFYYWQLRLHFPNPYE
jgi:hypothetical protein